jgi:hypothetical protein
MNETTLSTYAKVTEMRELPYSLGRTMAETINCGTSYISEERLHVTKPPCARMIFGNERRDTYMHHLIRYWCF